MANVLTAIKNIIENKKNVLANNVGNTHNRANAAGDALEEYIKDSFTNTFNSSKSNRWTNKCFSYLGNNSNPPDIMLKGGDAIEVKKVETLGKTELQLNSSYPKDKLHVTNPSITQQAKDCENWDIKDMLYCIGLVPNKTIKRLWFVYGDCFCANETTYTRLRNKIIDGIKQIEGVTFEETKELGRVNNVDPLSYTKLRIRGMWLLRNPNKIFEEFATYDVESTFQLFALMPLTKYNSFPENDRKGLENMVSKNFIIKEVNIPNPNNPALSIQCKLISYTQK